MERRDLSVTQLGARILSEEEIKLSLPTYQKILDQIAVIRSNIEKKDIVAEENTSKKRTAFVRRQVTNNFAILGPRGAGKTSILKTLYDQLEDQNSVSNGGGKINNILLPPIVPENMSSSATLMSTLLGLLKDPVEESVNKQETQQCRQGCCPVGKNELTKTYNKLVEDYIHLQEPYQNVTVEHYSSDWDYLQRMINVYKGGNQFSESFHELIDKLMEQEDDALLFIFIDDIDLSAARCADIVKTLLAYVAHPRIVTILAGDVNTFEEALTLDFLRQEELADARALHISYLPSGEDNDKESKLLQRKKSLAYEYMKKIMPPTYRHYVTRWSIRMRGQFQPVRYSETGERINVKLSAILKSIGEENELLSAYFQDDTESLNHFVTYHLFDSTARGLANAYLAVEQIVQVYKSKRIVNAENDRFLIFKSALETILSSNPKLNHYRDIVFGDFLQFGTTLEMTNIRFDNFLNWANVRTSKLSEKVKKDGKKEMSFIEQEVDAFRIFLFLDFAVRLLGKQKVLMTTSYFSSKNIALWLLCSNGYISERREIRDDSQRDALKKISEMVLQNDNAGNDADAQLSSLFRFDFPCALQFFTCLNIDAILTSQKSLTKEFELQSICNFLEILKKNYHDTNKTPNYTAIGAILEQHKEMYEKIGSHLQESKKAMYVSTIYQEYFSGDFAVHKKFQESVEKDAKKVMAINWTSGYLCNPQNSWERQINEIKSSYSAGASPLYNYYTEEIIPKFSDASGRPKAIILSEFDEDNSQKEQFETRIKVICAVDKNNLWGEGPSIEIIRYVESQLKLADRKIFNTVNLDIKVDVTSAKSKLEVFWEVYAGESNTMAAKCKSLLRKFWEFDSDENGRITISVSNYIWMRIVLNRLIYSNAWYGRPDARALLMALNKAKVVFENIPSWESDDGKIYLFWLQCYARYQIAIREKAHELVEQAHGYLDTISQAQNQYHKSCVESYEERLLHGTDMSLEELHQALKLF